jgi:large subunit ribosomal protein L20
MARVRKAVASRARRKKILKLAKGYRGGRSRLIRTAKEAVMRALQYAYRDRKNRKRQMRRLWITRISAASRERGIPYRDLIARLNQSGIEMDRKILSDIAALDPEAFDAIVRECQTTPAGS